MLCNLSVKTDHEIESRRPGLLIKRENNCQIMNVAILEDGKGASKRRRKRRKNQDLARDVRNMWDVRVKMIPITVGALGTIPLKSEETLRNIGVDTSIELILGSAVLETARILRKVPEM